MGFDEHIDREGIISTCQDLLRFQALFARHFALSQLRDFGAKGEASARAALRRLGCWRGGFIKSRLARSGMAPSARSIVENWDAADYHLLTELGTGSIEAAGVSVTVTTAQTPEWTYWKGHEGGRDLARLYYAEVLPGIAEALDARVEFDPAALDLEKPWPVTWSLSGAGQAAGAVHSGIFGRTEEAVSLARRTSMNNGQLYYFCADEETRRFDTEGEAALRASVRTLGIERADRLIALHEAEGLERSLLNLVERWDGALVSVWQFAPDRLVTDGAIHQDCTWCPYAAAWSEFGRRALELGWLYDYELHPTMFKRYNPELVVQFEAVKTRGDDLCKFRLYQPSKMREGDPEFAGYTGVDR